MRQEIHAAASALRPFVDEYREPAQALVPVTNGHVVAACGAVSRGRAQRGPCGVRDGHRDGQRHWAAMASAPEASRSNVLACQFHRWYPEHRRWTIRSRVLDLSPEFVEYLNADGFVLPTAAMDRCANDSDSSSWSESGDDGNAPGRGVMQEPGVDLPEIELIRSEIEKLGGAVIPKLNWSSPRDATWIACDGTMKCVTPADVLLLLKASDFIQHDLTQPFEACVDAADDARPVEYKLVLRQWAHLVQSREFRCFIRDRRIVAISQRDRLNYYAHLNQDGARECLRRAIDDFYRRRIRDTFPEENYVMDVYVDGDDVVFLIDFNPFSVVTDALLFTWPELMRLGSSSSHCEFRIVEQQPALGPSETMSYGFPQDVLQMNSAEAIERFATDYRNGAFREEHSDDDDSISQDP